MAGQKTLTLLIVMLSIACILGLPTEEDSNDKKTSHEEIEPKTEEEDSNDKETSYEELEPKYQLLVDTIKNYNELALSYINEAHNITEDILKDETLLAHIKSSAKIEEFHKNLTDYIEKYHIYHEDEDDEEQLNNLVDIFANATEFYMKLSKEDITSDTAVIIDILQKYGSDKLEKKFDKLLQDFVETFKEQFEKTKGHLKEEKGMLEWFDHFKTLTNVEDQAAAFEELGKFYD